jgi:hypothetical protein
VDVDLTGVVIPAGQTYIINSNANGACTGAFNGIYGFPPNRSTNFLFGVGNERFLLTDTANGSHILDIYGQFGVDGTGHPWQFDNGYAYRLPEWHSGAGLDFATQEWFFGGPGSLAGPNATELLLTLTTPAVHDFYGLCNGPRGDLDGDGDVDVIDFTILTACLTGPEAQVSLPCLPADLDGDGDADAGDFAIFQGAYGN